MKGESVLSALIFIMAASGGVFSSQLSSQLLRRGFRVDGQLRLMRRSRSGAQCGRTFWSAINSSPLGRRHGECSAPRGRLASTALSEVQKLRGGHGANASIRWSHLTSGRSQESGWRKAYIAVGSNLGDRYQNIANALSLLETGSNGTIRITRTSYLRVTSPMYVTDQPAFLNGAVELETTLSPLELLKSLKRAESDLGRDVNYTRRETMRYGPRTVDLDIILFDGYDAMNDDGSAAETLDENDLQPCSLIMKTEELEIPHPRMMERVFVLSPMSDLERAVERIRHPVVNRSMGEILSSLSHQSAGASKDQGIRVIPLPRARMLHFNETIVMGILNVTPDSFSDGGKYSDSSEYAASAALKLVQEGAGIIDVGGESTRPGAEEVAIEEELQRVIPVIRSIRKESDVPISIDTRNSRVAMAAVEAGADIVNDVSGGTHDPEMLGVVSSLDVPMIIMHMRGNPKTMQTMTNYSEEEGGVVVSVANKLKKRSQAAEEAGIPRWMQILDPGIGFAKDLDGNLTLMREAEELRQLCLEIPFLYGPSRKGFIGRITGETSPERRDYGTIAACLACVKGGGCTILRVHNVRAVKQALQVFDAIHKK